MPTAHFSLGSNIPPCPDHLAGALELLEQYIGSPATCSDPFLSAPMGYQSNQEYTNIGANFTTDLSPERLLEIALLVEHRIDPDGRHRDAEGNYCDRRIDVDLIAVDSLTSDADPVLPHPRMHQRPFVLVPMTQVWPQWRHPLLHLSPGELLARISPTD